jgi:hypothetical protein
MSGGENSSSLTAVRADLVNQPCWSSVVLVKKADYWSAAIDL